MLKGMTFVALFSVVFGFPNFRDRIPNGNRIPNPCPGQTGTIWNGVGHNQPQGSGPRNPFGKAFEHLAGFKWTKELCLTDSDQDGRSNGEELGDPLCAWSIGHIATQPPTGHPGICEPMTAANCVRLNAFIKCP